MGQLLEKGRGKILFALKQENICIFLLEVVDDLVVFIISAADILSQGIEVVCQLAELFMAKAPLVNLCDRVGQIGVQIVVPHIVGDQDGISAELDGLVVIRIKLPGWISREIEVRVWTGYLFQVLRSLMPLTMGIISEAIEILCGLFPLTIDLFSEVVEAGDMRHRV